MKRCLSCFMEYADEFQICPHCGCVEITEPKEPIHLIPGTILAGRYVLGHAVGSGGFGIVYKAWDLKLETIVAVKEFFMSRSVTRAAGYTEVIVSKKSLDEFEYRKERFLAEARTMAKFGAHRSIPNVFEFFEENNTAYIVMELLNGVALNDYLHQKGGIIDTEVALMIANEVGKALKSLHEQGIVHRDVAPDNIFICSEKEIRIKLMDLGAAKLADSTDKGIDIILKPGYSPAEQYDNSKNIGPWSDIYALGATMYVMLTGVKPDESTNRKIEDTVVPPHELNPDISENLSNTIMKAMAIEKHMRFKNMSEFLSAINGQRKVYTLKKEKSRRNTGRALKAIAAILIIAIIGGIVFDVLSKRWESEHLKPAEIDVWFSVTDGSTEKEAMESIATDFMANFPDVTINLRAIHESGYEAVLTEASAQGDLPDLFESTGLPDEILEKTRNVTKVLKSEQAKKCRFLKQYNKYYKNKKQLPLGIEVPVAYVITNGVVSVDFNEAYFTNLLEFGSEISVAIDEQREVLLGKNIDVASCYDRDGFLNNSANEYPVMLSSTMAINEVREVLTNYEKYCSFYNGDVIHCGFVYEWSLGKGTKEQNAAADMLLSWMLGNVYQSTLMITECSDGQIPLNDTCFQTKIEAKNLAPIAEIYKKFVFENED